MYLFIDFKALIIEQLITVLMPCENPVGCFVVYSCLLSAKIKFVFVLRSQTSPVNYVLFI